ncbi:hypothetical protein HDG33_006249 [Paraburkholderia sp. Cpub6]|nr:hypothetical protein [Paraburkholderia sp. Cpub6]
MYMNLEGAYGMALSLTVFMAGTLDQATAGSLLERAKGICPYLDAWLRNIASARPPSRSRASMTTTETSCACSTRASARPRRPAPTMATSTTSDSTEVISPLRAQKQKTATAAPRLHGRRNGRLDIDLSHDFDEVAVRDQVVRGRRMAANRLVEQRARGRHVIQQRAVCAIGREPMAEMLGLRQPLQLRPAALRPRLRQRAMQCRRRRRHGEGLIHDAHQRLPMLEVFDELRRLGQPGADLVQHADLGRDDFGERERRGRDGRIGAQREQRRSQVRNDAARTQAFGDGLD